LSSNSDPVGSSAVGKRAVQQLVVMANGEVRVPPMGSEVAHGHRAPDEHIKIVMPAGKNWLLLQIDIELDGTGPAGNAAKLP
jgi:hypothetical protein